MYLSDHFTVYEMAKSSFALRHKIDNTPSVQVVERLRRVAAEILEPIREHFGIPFAPASGYRSIPLNRALGSQDSSQHITGEAVDLELPGVNNYDLAFWIYKNLRFDQLILECYKPENPSSGWVHCSYVDRNSRCQILTYNGERYENGLIG